MTLFDINKREREVSFKIFSHSLLEQSAISAKMQASFYITKHYIKGRDIKKGYDNRVTRYRYIFGQRFIRFLISYFFPSYCSLLFSLK